VPIGIRYPEGTHVPYPVRFVETENLERERRALAQERPAAGSSLCYVSYAIVTDPEYRSVFASALQGQLQMERDAPLPSFVPVEVRSIL